MDDDVKAILSDLARAINDGLERSRKVAEAVRRLEALGYRFSLYLDATILLSKDEPRAARSRRPGKRVRSGTLKLSDKDLGLLRSLRIGLEEGKPR